MNASGESEFNISVGEPVRNAYIFYEVYDEFFDFLDNLQSTGIIAEWKALPYDWRYDVYDVAESEQLLTDETLLNLADEIRSLAASSDTGTVTLIAHSNGGLVGKALIDVLGPDAALIDRFIMIGAPQLGTPSAISAMLHGTEQGLPLDAAPLAMSRVTARELSENMPGAYGLLPLLGYFGAVLEPVAYFDDFADTAAFRTAYGDAIDTSFELYSFLLGTDDGRAKPESSDTRTPTTLNSDLLANSFATRSALESWEPPGEMEVLQIVGWGLDTPKAVHYYRRCELLIFCFMDVKPEFTSDGDKTVVSRSADAMAAIADTFYLDLSAFNTEYQTNWSHANLLAASSTQDILKDIFLEEERAAEFMTTTQPIAADKDKRLRVSVHSPLSLGVRDAANRFTGIMENPDPSSDIPVIVEEIPNSYYLEFGEGKYIGLNADGLFNIVMQGSGAGVATIEVEEVEADAVVQTVVYSDVPVSPSTVATLDIQNLESQNDLMVDEDGNGTIDLIIAPDAAETPLSELLSLLKQKVQELDIKERLKQQLLKKIDSLEKKIAKKKEKNANILANLERKITKQEMKGKIVAADAAELIALIEELEAQTNTVVLDAEVLAALSDKIKSLDIEKGLKNDLLKRVEKLAKKQMLTKSLSNLANKITKQGARGNIADEDAQALLTLLTQIENAL
jgi:pimeloyl-ACP methyl ester carboxylesterase